MRALIVDDDESDRLAIANAFTLAGFDVTTAPDGKEALGLLRQQGADVIVLDLIMPVLDGYDFLEAVRSDAELSDTPVIVVTAAEYDARLAHTVAYVKKPCRMAELIDRARRWVSARANA